MARHPAEDPAHRILSSRDPGDGPCRGGVHRLHGCVKRRPIWRIRAWRAWRLPGRWPDGGRRRTVARWTSNSFQISFLKTKNRARFIFRVKIGNFFVTFVSVTFQVDRIWNKRVWRENTSNRSLACENYRSVTRSKNDCRRGSRNSKKYEEIRDPSTDEIIIQGNK